VANNRSFSGSLGNVGMTPFTVPELLLYPKYIIDPEMLDVKRRDGRPIQPIQPRQQSLLIDEMPPEFWCYEVQHRVKTGRPFNDGWTDWVPWRFPNRFSTKRRAEARLKKLLGDFGTTLVGLPRETRIEPIYLGRKPEFKWERKRPS
jgi:hypothetical protein